MSERSVFTRILEGELPGDFVYQDPEIVAIRDIRPAAPIHLLVFPRRPIVSLEAAQAEDADLLGRLLLVANRVAAQEGLTRGYRVIINTGEEGGQTVPHLHLHILGGTKLSERMLP